MFAVAYEWDFEEIVGIRGVSAVAVDVASGDDFSIYVASGALGSLSSFIYSPWKNATENYPSAQDGLVDAVGNRFASIAYTKV